MLLNYGFVDEDNSYDRLIVEVKSGYLLFVVSILFFNSVDYVICCMFQAALNTEDPQYQDKRMVAQRNGKLSVQVFHVWTKKKITFGYFFLLLFFIFLGGVVKANVW